MFARLLVAVLVVAVAAAAESKSGGSGASDGPRRGAAVADSRDLFWASETWLYWRQQQSWQLADDTCYASSGSLSHSGSRLISLSNHANLAELVRIWNNPLGWDFTQDEVTNSLTYVGLRREGNEWRWLDGHLLDTSIIDWAPGYPNSVAGADCTRIFWPQLTLANTLCDSRESSATAFYICDRQCRVSVNCEDYGCTFEGGEVGSHCAQCAPQHTYVDVLEDRCLDCNIGVYHGQVLCAPVNTDHDTCLKTHLCCPEHWAANTDLCFVPN